jgi:hypothetical protein
VSVKEAVSNQESMYADQSKMQKKNNAIKQLFKRKKAPVTYRDIDIQWAHEPGGDLEETLVVGGAINVATHRTNRLIESARPKLSARKVV